MLKDPPLPGCIAILAETMNYPAAELRGIKMNLKLIYPDAEHRGILLIFFGLFRVFVLSWFRVKSSFSFPVRFIRLAL